jgi:chromosomal replication initiator protein
MIENKQLWESALIEIELNVSKANFNTWFKNTCIIKQDSGIIQLSVPNEFAKDWLCNKYHKFILKALRNYGESVRGLEYVVSKNKPNTQQLQKETSSQHFNTELPLDNLYINKEDNLNPKYTFESFIIGSFNELAHAAAQAIIKTPGSVYNPLFIHGGTGLGKTHLIQAIGNEIKKNDPKKKVFYVTSEKFSIDYINSLQTNKINNFKEKYRKYDVFIMDDTQFLSNKEKTQEELFHLFNTLYEENKQIIFSSDQHPNYIPNMEDRLKSRFSAGMIIDVQQPEYESRIAILKSKSLINNFLLSDEIIDYLASSINGNIRELEGILNLIMCQSQLKNRCLTINEARFIIKNNIKQKKSVSVKDVVKIVSDFYEVDEKTIYEKTRKKEIVKPRQIIMYLLRKDFNVSYPTIGQKMGGRDHTTVIHSCDKITCDLKKDNLLTQEIDQIRAMF